MWLDFNRGVPFFSLSFACFSAVFDATVIHPGNANERFFKQNLPSLLEWAEKLNSAMEDTQSNAIHTNRVLVPIGTIRGNLYQEIQIRKPVETTQNLDVLASIAMIRLETSQRKRRSNFNFWEHCAVEPPLKLKLEDYAKEGKSDKYQFQSQLSYNIPKFKADIIDKSFLIDNGDDLWEDSGSKEVEAEDDSKSSLVSDDENVIFAYFTYQESQKKSTKKEFCYKIGGKTNVVFLEVSNVSTNLRNFSAIKEKLLETFKISVPQHQEKKFRVKTVFESDRDFISGSHFLDRLLNPSKLVEMIDFRFKRIKIIRMARKESVKMTRSFKVGDKYIAFEFQNIKDNTLVIHKDLTFYLLFICRKSSSFRFKSAFNKNPIVVRV